MPDAPLCALAFAPLLMASALAHHPFARRMSRQAMEQAAQYSAHMVEDASGVETIKAFGCEQLRIDQGESRLVRVVQPRCQRRELDHPSP